MKENNQAPLSSCAARPTAKRTPRPPLERLNSGLVPTLVVPALAVILMSSCVSEDTAGEGNLALALSGGVAMSQGFPHREFNVDHRFVDGWQVSFHKWVTAMADVILTEPNRPDRVVTRTEGVTIMDLQADGTGNLDWLVIEGLPARRHDIGFSMVRATDDALLVGVDEAVALEMVENGWSLLVAGEATRGDEQIQFRLGLDAASRYSGCVNGKDGTQGVAIENNKTTGAYIFHHPHHLFWDSLASGNTQLRFDAFAAVSGHDNLITGEDLYAQDLTDLRDRDGEPLRDSSGRRVFYNDGGLLTPGALTLGDFVVQAARNAIHFNGVGLCRIDPL